MIPSLVIAPLVLAVFSDDEDETSLERQIERAMILKDPGLVPMMTASEHGRVVNQLGKWAWSATTLDELQQRLEMVVIVANNDEMGSFDAWRGFGGSYVRGVWFNHVPDELIDEGLDWLKTRPEAVYVDLEEIGMQEVVSWDENFILVRTDGESPADDYLPQYYKIDRNPERLNLWRSMWIDALHLAQERRDSRLQGYSERLDEGT